MSLKNWFAIASLTILMASGCSNKVVSPEVVTPPPSSAPTMPEAGVRISHRAVGTHQTLFVAQSNHFPTTYTLLSMSMLGKNGKMDFAEMEVLVPARRWEHVLNVAPKNLDTLTLVFQDENGEIVTARLTPNP